MAEDINGVSTALLKWYDVHARELPWRVAPELSKSGHLPDPYKIWLSEIMLQQTGVVVVKSYFEHFTSTWPNVADLAAEQDAVVMAAWAGLGYYARARNLLKCARSVTSVHQGQFPSDVEGLLKLPGIGPYTAAAITSIAFGACEVVVDGNVERVMARLFAIKTPLPMAKVELKAKAALLTPKVRAGDHAQALMDLGSTICTVRRPKCEGCPLAQYCVAQGQGIAAELPKRQKKTPKPIRLGYAYVGLRADGAYLLERRANKGLLGGMLGWPGSDWNGSPVDQPPFTAQWREITTEVRHTFTHFHLRLKIKTARMPGEFTPSQGIIVPKEDFSADDLPTVMRKVYAASRGTDSSG